MNQTQNPTAIQSQKWILETMLELVEESEYHKITVSEICRRAGLDRRTFYRNFESKNDVLEYYIEILSREYLTELNDVNPQGNYEITLLFFRFWEKHLQFIRNMLHCGLSDYVFVRFQQFSKAHQNRLSGGGFSEPNEYAFAYRLGGFWNVMLTWAKNQDDVTAEELAGIISDKGL